MLGFVTADASFLFYLVFMFFICLLEHLGLRNCLIFFFFFCQSCWELCYPSMFSINRVGSYFFCFNPAVSFSVLLFTTLPQYSMLYFIVNIQKVICNIPLVSVGILSVEGAPENNVHETHYGKEWFTMRC